MNVTAVHIARFGIATLVAAFAVGCGGGGAKPSDGGARDGGPRDGGTTAAVTLRLSLSPELCASLQSPARGGGPMDGTLVSTTAPGFMSTATFSPDVHPCAGGDGGANLRVELAAGTNRTLAISILGRPIAESRPELGISNRPIFFAGGAPLGPAEFEGAEIDLFFAPHVNLVLDAPPGSDVRFMRPRRACVGAGDDDATQVDTLAQVVMPPSGRTFAALPYEGSEEACVGRSHGNELFVFVTTPEGAVALLVPGRARTPGDGIDPGMLISEAMVLPRVPSAAGLDSPALTGLSRIPNGRTLVLQLSGFGILRAVPAPMRLQSLDTGTDEPLTLRFDDGEQAFGPFDSYASLRVFGTAAPNSVQATLVDGDVPRALPPGEYELVVGEGAGIRSLRFEILQ